MDQFNNLQDFENFIFNNELPSDQIPDAVDQLMALTFPTNPAEKENFEVPPEMFEPWNDWENELLLLDVPPEMVEPWNDWENQWRDVEPQMGGGPAPTAQKPSSKTPNHRCELCEKTFTRPDNLKRHLKTHNNEKNVQCPRCIKAFTRQSDMKRHVRDVHDKQNIERTYQCTKCGQTFQNKTPFQAHIQTAHKKRQATNSSDTPPKKKAKQEPKAKPRPRPEWQEDPRKVTDLPAEQQNNVQEYRNNWHQIRTRFSRGNRLLDWYNFRLNTPQDLLAPLNNIFHDQSTVFKINVSFGYLLRNTETGTVQYHYASRNNNQVFEEPFLLSTLADLEPFREALRNLDVTEWVRQHRPNSKWVVEQVTNITFFVTKLKNHPIGRGKCLPHYVVENRGVVPLDCNYQTGKPYQDHLCFFRALAFHNGCHKKNLERDTLHYYERYRQQHPGIKRFCGVTLNDLPDLEKLFEVNIFVYSLEPNSTEDEQAQVVAQSVFRSFRQFSSTMYLNLHQKHFSYIKDLKRYSKSFCCSRCGKYFPRADNHRRHERTCEAKVRHKFPGGTYKTPKSIFDLLEDEEIVVPKNLRFFPYRATFDFECLLDRSECPNDTEKVYWEAKHVPLSVSVCSNVPQYTHPRCFVSEGDPKQLVRDLIQYLKEISTASFSLLNQQFQPIFELIDQKIGPEQNDEPEEQSSDEESDERGIDVMESDDEDEECINPENEEDRAFINDEDVEEQDLAFYQVLNQEPNHFAVPVGQPVELNNRPQKKKPLKKLKERLIDYLKELPVLGFNSGKYDLNAAREFLFPVLVQDEAVQFAIKRNNNFMCLKTEHLQFLDVMNFLAPGFSYAKFLKAYECPQTKGFFPYEWMDSLEKLNHPSLPPHEAFYSSLTQSNISEEDYRYCQQVWEEQQMTTFQDFLTWYNNLDVVPFVEALQKMCEFWKNKNIDMLRQGISIPGITLTYLFMTLEPGVFFSLFDEKNKDLYRLFKDNMVGGPSIIFHRYHEKNKTKLRQHELGEQAKLCRKIVGYDANALYLWAIMQPMPTGAFTRRREETGFQPERSVKMATEWLEWEAHTRNISIRHQINNTEKRIGDRRLPVDGFHDRTVFQFHGCYWHGHDCYLNQGKTINATRKKPLSELLEETRTNSRYIQDEGYHLIEMWECQWRSLKRRQRSIQQFLNAHVYRPLDQKKTLTQKEILEAVKRGQLFGVVECDIRVPEHLKPKFSEMCPIFKNTTISRDDIGEYMRDFAVEHDIMPQPRRSLIGSLFGTKILLATPLIRWYLDHGLEITRIHQLVEYTPNACFQPFGNAVSNARRAGDVDPNKAIIADTMKLVGNSSYGKTITNQERHRNVEYCEESKASRLVNSPFFRQLDAIDEQTYEVQSSKKTIHLNLPMQIGFFVYQYAKLRMLQFYYDFLDKYVDRSDFEYCEMDTDSAYIAIAGESVESLVKPEMRDEFQKDKCNWFPRTDTPENKAYDKRTPGLFKEEWSGEGIIGLCSKTYYCFGTSDKFSCKGVSKRNNEIDKEKYLNVLRTQQSSSGINKGFRVVKNNIYTYQQTRAGFSYFYPKRKVLEDGVSTLPLDI